MSFGTRTKPITRNVRLARRVRLREFTYKPRTTAAGLKQETDRVAPLIVKTRDGWRCVMCGRSDVRIESGHLFPRGHWPSRWLLENNFAQCTFCNNAHNDDRNPYTYWFLGRFGSDAHARLRDIAYSKHKWTFAELEFLGEQYRMIYQPLLKGWDFTEACQQANYKLFIEF
jgi:hypothetical protein